MICINSVTVYPSSATITKGQWYYGAWASISSNCPGCAEVRWYSNNSSIASVNATTGYIYGVGTGTTRIYAEATDGSGKKDYITVTVTAPISVTGISISPASKTMNVGDTDYLCETVYPSNATNQTVTWCSSNDSVATVNTYTGFVRAKKAGIVTITACTLDGGFTASCTVTVFIDTVTIQKDGNFNTVVFSKSGKVWRCINHDMLFNEENRSNQTLINRTRHNFLTYYDEQNPPNSNWTPKEYTDDELKLLYAIDPYGVADYVEKFAPGDEGGLENTLREKDRMFKLLFGRDPKYFARTIDGVWFETTNVNNLSAVQSESECVFGMHPIWDNYTVRQIIEAIVSMVDIVLTIVSPAPRVSDFLKAHKTVDTVAKIFSFTANSTTSGLLFGTIDTFSGEAFDKISLSWACDMVSAFNSVQEIVASFGEEQSYYPQVFDYCANNLNYNIYVQLQNGQQFQIGEISQLITNN